MKAVISDRIYLEVLPHTQKKIDDELTYAIPSFKYSDPPIIIKNMALIKNEHLINKFKIFNAIVFNQMIDFFHYNFWRPHPVGCFSERRIDTTKVAFVRTTQASVHSRIG